MNATKDYYNERLEYNKMYKFIFSQSIPRLFDDFLITTGIKNYDPTSAIHTSLLYEYCLGRALSQNYTIKEYQIIMDKMNRYVLEKSREGAIGD